MKKGESYQALVEALAIRNCVLFIGAGLSIGSGLPGWGKLLELLDARLETRLGAPRGNFLNYAEKLDLKVGRLRLGTALRAILESPEYAPSLVHRSLLSLPLHAVFTTNYDNLIEKTLGLLNRRHDSICYDEEVGVIDGQEALPVIKFHGDLEDPPGIVLTETDYLLYHIKHPAFTPLFEAMLATRTFVFVGFGLTDSNFKALDKTVQRALGRYRRKAFAIMVKTSSEEIPQLPHFNILGVPIEQIDSFLIELAHDVHNLVDLDRSIPMGIQTEIHNSLRENLAKLPKKLFIFSDKEPSRPPQDSVSWSERKCIYHILFQSKRFYIQDAELSKNLGIVLFKIRDYRASLRAFSQVSLQDAEASRIIARCYWYLGEKWRARRILERQLFPKGTSQSLDLDYLEKWPGDVALYAHTCNWEASEHLERRRYHRTLKLTRRGLEVLEAWLALNPSIPQRSHWIWRYIYNHIGRSQLLQIQAGEPIPSHVKQAEESLNKAIQLANGSFAEAWSNLLDLFNACGNRRKTEAFIQHVRVTCKRSVLKSLKEWHPNIDWRKT